MLQFAQNQADASSVVFLEMCDMETLRYTNKHIGSFVRLILIYWHKIF